MSTLCVSLIPLLRTKRTQDTFEAPALSFSGATFMHHKRACDLQTSGLSYTGANPVSRGIMTPFIRFAENRA